MLNPTKLALAAALAAAFSFTSFSANAADLESLSKTNWQDTLKKSTKPVLLLVTGANCKACDVLEAVLKTSADTHGDVKFAKIDSNEVGLPADQLPYVVYSYPSAGITVSGVSLSLKTEADVSKALGVWSTSGAKTVELKVKYAELSKLLDQTAAPFEEETKKLLNKKKEATKDVVKAYGDAKAQYNVKAKHYDDQIASIEAERDNALAGDYKKLELALDAIEAAEKPFNEEYAKLREATASAVSNTREEMDKVAKAQRRLKAKDNWLLDNGE